MPKLTGAFDLLKDLEKIPPENVIRWTKLKLEPKRISDFIANRIYYPQTIAISKEEMAIDLAILREGLRINKQSFYDEQNKIILIPERLVQRFFPFNDLVRAFLDTIVFEGVTQVLVEEKGKKILVGSVYSLNTREDIVVDIDEKQLKLQKDSLTLYPLTKSQAHLIVNNTKMIVYGGKLGLYLDLREKKWLL